MGAFFRTNLFSVQLRYGNAMLRYESGCLGMTSSLGLRCWTLALCAGLFRLMEEYNVHPVLGLLVLARSNEINFGFTDEPDLILSNFEDSIVYGL